MKLIKRGRCRAGARHAAWPLRHPAPARPRLLAEERQDHPDRQRPPHARPREADLGRHRAATPRRPRRRCPIAWPNRKLACAANADERKKRIKAEKDAWEKELADWTQEKDAWSLEIAKGSPYMHPRQMLRELEKAMPKNAMVSTDIGNICSVSNSYLRFDAAQLDVRRDELRQLRLCAALDHRRQGGGARPAGRRLCRRRRLGHELRRDPDLRARGHPGRRPWSSTTSSGVPRRRTRSISTTHRFLGVNLKNPSWADVAGRWARRA